jgi:hypothetical protein
MSTETTNTTPATQRTVQLPSARTMFGAVIVACILLPFAAFLGDIVFTDNDPYRNEGPVDSFISIGVVGGIALVLAMGVGAVLVRSPERARIGAVVFAALSVLTLAVFWSGAPGLFGAAAAWLSGLTRGGRPLDGAARVAGIVGAFVAVLNVLLALGGMALSVII